ncbi:hypothetical protein MPSEU_000737400 [Mayamaea pseudoterrestris]|nr:hypothetical protein MPSEU_000737400 [Mayamaea pseudoterrestris]
METRYNNLEADAGPSESDESFEMSTGVDFYLRDGQGNGNSDSGRSLSNNCNPMHGDMATEYASAPPSHDERTVVSTHSTKGTGTDERPMKRIRLQHAHDSSLHRACCRSDVTVDDLAQLLLQDPSSVTRQVRLVSPKMVFNPFTYKVEQRVVAEPFKYALNLAIHHGASFDVIEMLMIADPSVLLKCDGLQCESSLLILLKRSPSSCMKVDLLLQQDPRCASLTDRHQNTALHVACFSGASMEVISHLCCIHRAAIGMRDFHGRTPLQVAQNRISSCSDEIVQFLWSMSG